MFILLSYALFAQAALVNNTIDDTYGDLNTGVMPVYSDAGWALGQSCDTCFVKPDKTLAFMNSWHDATHHSGTSLELSVNITFSGMSFSRNQSLY